MFLLSIGFISAVANPTPFTQSSTNGLQVFFPGMDIVLKTNNNHTFTVQAENITSGLNVLNTDVNCTIFIHDKDGNGLVEQNMTQQGDTEFEITILGGNFSYVGDYSIFVYCRNGNIGGSIGSAVTATGSGEGLDVQTVFLYSVGIFILISVMFIMIFLSYNLPSKDTLDENGAILQINNLKHLRPVLWMLSWITFMSIVFIVGNLTLAYFNSAMIGNIITDMFIVMFAITLVGLPLWFLKIVTDFFRDREFKRMIERGVEVKSL